MKIVYLLILTFSVSSFSKEFNKEYDFLINEVSLDIEKHCRTKIKKNIIYKWMPKGLEPIQPSLAFVSFFSDENWIEFHSKFKDLSLKEKKLVLYHEIGHVYGLEHKKSSIMTNPLEEVVEDFKGFYLEICPKVVK